MPITQLYGVTHLLVQTLHTLIVIASNPATLFDGQGADLKAANLDRGRKESIALALSKNALLLMDEERGRNYARQKNLQVRGSFGILIEAYARKLISEDQLRFYFQQISERKDIWINPDLCVRLLEKIFGHDPS